MTSEVPEQSRRRPLVVGVLSDTHGHLYPEVVAGLQGVDHIVHAGDIGSPRVLDALKAIAPVTAVKGNCDLEGWAATLPAAAEISLAGVRVLVGHIGDRLSKSGFDVVICGHTHRPASEVRDGVLHLNPGSAGPERFGRPRTMAKLLIAPSPSEQCGDAAPAQALGAARVSVEMVILPSG